MIRNRLLNEMADMEGDAVPFPAQLRMTKPLGENDDLDFLPLYARQSAALVRNTTATELITMLASDAKQCLQAFA